MTCPDLPEARTAELEVRARATLLTSEIAAKAAISCTGELVVVRVEADDDSVALQLRVRPATLREEVLRALDRALADLRARKTPAAEADGSLGAPSTTGQSATTPAQAEKPKAPDVLAPADATPSASEDEPPSRRELELGAQLMGESWGKQAALGGGVDAAVGFDSGWWCGIRVGAFRPLGVEDVSVIEGHALAEAAFTANALAGLRFGVGAGPSLLFASPGSGFSARGGTWKSAVRLEAQLSRPFRWGRVQLAPWLGLRFFTAERGVRVAQQTPVLLGGVQPQLGLALSLGD